MTDHFQHAARYARPDRAPSAGVSLLLAVTSWLFIAGLAGLALVLGGR